MRVGVITFPGSNCDWDVIHALQELQAPVELLAYDRPALPDFGGIILPGGFSYGDYLRAGAIARFSPILQELPDFAAAGGLVLGICNGFQILCEMGLLPGALHRNRDIRFHCEPVYLRVERNTTPFTRSCQVGDRLRLPIAHGQGNYYVSPLQLSALERRNQVVFRYATASGEVSEGANPNGSVDNIAGVCSPEGNVMGLMPHPERATETLLGGLDGRLILEGFLEEVGQRV